MDSSPECRGRSSKTTGNPMRLRNVLSISSLTALCAFAISTQAACAQVMPATQTQASGNAPIPVIHANTRAVVVDVVVTKGQDEPVTALHKQDFELLEDGKPQSIDFFEEHTAPVS